jgi:hypothetical protein
MKMEWNRLGFLLLMIVVLILSTEVIEALKLSPWWRAIALLLMLMLLEYRRELGRLLVQRSSFVKGETAGRPNLTQEQSCLVKENCRGATANDGALGKDEEDSRFSSGNEDDELGSKIGPSSDSQVEATSFMFDLPEELVRNQILLRVYVARDSRTTSISALHMLCVLRLVC